MNCWLCGVAVVSFSLRASSIFPVEIFLSFTITRMFLLTDELITANFF